MAKKRKAFPIIKLKSSKGTQEFIRTHNKAQIIAMHAVLHYPATHRRITYEKARLAHDRIVRHVWGSVVGHGSPMPKR